MKMFFLRIFIKKSEKVLEIQEKVVPLHPQFDRSVDAKLSLGYGVMVTLQILVLPFLVRVRVPQQREMFVRASLFFVSPPLIVLM